MKKRFTFFVASSSYGARRAARRGSSVTKPPFALLSRSGLSWAGYFYEIKKEKLVSINAQIPFTKVYYEILDKVSPRAAILYGLIMGTKGTFRKTNAYLADKLKCSEYQIKTVLKQLEDQKLITREVFHFTKNYAVKTRRIIKIQLILVRAAPTGGKPVVD